MTSGANIPGLRIAIEVARQGWTRSLPDAAKLGRQAARRALKAGLASGQPRPASLAGRPSLQCALILSDDAPVRVLNRDYRGKDQPTNVLSFAALDGLPLDSKGLAHHFPTDAPIHLGDVILALGTLKREAREQHKSLKQHYVHLVVHGVLHLLGFDHMRARDALRMEALEREVLAGLGWPDPYLLV